MDSKDFGALEAEMIIEVYGKYVEKSNGFEDSGSLNEVFEEAPIRTINGRKKQIMAKFWQK
jgi:hypothetical protein